jgi:NADPH:quinone reductase-like Zn-dependent oxidoreductase
MSDRLPLALAINDYDHGRNLASGVVGVIGALPTVGEYATPTAGPGQVVVDVTLAGLNPVDRLRADGYEYISPVTPFVAGREGVGRLDGRRVYFHEAVEPYGSFATQALVKADELLTVPEGLADEQAIPLGIAGLTAWCALTDGARIAPGDRVTELYDLDDVASAWGELLSSAHRKLMIAP